MTDTTLALYGDPLWISPYVFTCVVALEEKRLPYTYVPIDMKTAAQKSADYVARSLTGRVPSLAHGAFSLAESQAIVEYLDESFADTARVLPTDTQHRARARQVLAWIRSDLMPIREERSTTTMFYDRANKPLSPQGVVAAEKLVRVAEALVPADGGYLFGDFSVADGDLAFMLHRLILNGDPVPERITTWAKRVFERPSVQAFVAAPRAAFFPYSY